MIGLGKSPSVPEYEATGETARIYEDAKQTLRLSAVPLAFRTWARFEAFFPLMWNALKSDAETRAFEEAADRVRAEAADAAQGLGRLNAAAQAKLGESQAYHVRAALDFFRYANPKLLVFAAAVALGLDGELSSVPDAGSAEMLARGVPVKMAPLELAPERPSDPSARRVFKDIQRRLGGPEPDDEWRALALWPGYLSAAWETATQVLDRDDLKSARERLLGLAREGGRRLPFPAELGRERLAEQGEDVEGLAAETRRLAESLSRQTLLVAALSLDWRPVEAARESPFPAPPRFAAVPR